MTTSNVTTFNMTGDEIIYAAHRKLSVVGDGEPLSATQLINGRQALNSMLKLFQAKGMPLWALSETTLVPLATATYTYGIGQTYNIPAPLKVISARIVETTSGNQIPLNLVTRDGFNMLSTSKQTGRPVSFWYEPLNQVGVMHLWPIPDATTIAQYTIKFTAQRPVADMVVSGDTLDYPQWWHDAIIYGLAQRLAPEFGIPLQDRQLLQREASEYMNEALSFGTEEGSMYMMPDWAGR